MIVVERQVHGYRQGHQLLAASAQLPKAEQAVVDRLSDVAGPLRPRERFEPYLTAYPLPGGDRFVLARTWQDSTVTRAGCVRSLSLIIPAEEWAAAKGLSSFFDLLQLDRLPEDSDATRSVVSSCDGRPLPPAPDFSGTELLEALFLEEARPVVVFDAPRPDLIAIRLLTALWPSLRRRFAVSTFALSPRRIAGRDFDLVFAPKDARAKFSDWNGRRVDGRSDQTARHRWTDAIVGRVFDQSSPHLLPPNAMGIVTDEDDVDYAAALRIALLWEELIGKLDTAPTAALGLLDIVNSGKVRGAEALESLEELLGKAVLQATSDLPEAEAWDFLGAIARKLQRGSMPFGVHAVEEAVSALAARAPEGAIALLSQPDPKGVVTNLVPRIADGIGEHFNARSGMALLAATSVTLGRLIAASRPLAAAASGDAALIERLGQILPALDDVLIDKMKTSMLPLLVEDRQLPIAKHLVVRLDGQELAAELRHLGRANDFAAIAMAELIVDHARKIGARIDVRNALIGPTKTKHRDIALARTLDPSVEDATWLLRKAEIPIESSSRLLTGLLEKADDRQLTAIAGDQTIGSDVVRIVERDAPAMLKRFVLVDAVPLDLFVRIIPSALSAADPGTKVVIAKRALHRCLGSSFGGDEMAFLVKILGVVGENLDGAWAGRIGLARDVHPKIASRNMVAFRKAAQPARLRIVWSISDIGKILRDRHVFDLDADAADACAHFLFDAEKVTSSALLHAASDLVPMLMQQRNDPVSLMIAATFPMIYRELAKKDDVPDFLKFFSFFDWDRCKTARQELVSAFISSTWAPGDLALTAWRCGDVGRILRRTAKSNSGEDYLNRLAGDLARLPTACRNDVERIIAAIRADWSSKYDWRD